MMTVLPFEAEDFLSVEWREEQKPFAHLATQEVAESIIEHGHGLTARDEEGRIIAVAGVVPTRILVDGEGRQTPLLSYAVAAFSPLLQAHAKSVFKRILAFLDERPEERIEMHVDPAFAKAARFAEALGFEFARTEYEEAVGRWLHVYARVK